MAVPFFSSAARMLVARLVPATRFLPSSVSRKVERASTRRVMARMSSDSGRDDRVDKVVARAGVAEIGFQAVVEEGEEA